MDNCNLKAELSQQRRERLGDVHVNFCGASTEHQNVAKEGSLAMRPRGGDKRQQHTAPAAERSRSTTKEEERLGSMLKERFDHNSCALQRFRTNTLWKMQKNLTPWQKEWDKFDMIKLARKFEAEKTNGQRTYSTDMNLSLLAPNNSVPLYKVGTFAPEIADGCAGMLNNRSSNSMEHLYDTKKYMDNNRNRPCVDIAVQRVPSKRTLQFASDLVKSPPSKERVVDEGYGYGHHGKEVQQQQQQQQQQQIESDNVQQRLNALREVGSGAHSIGSSPSSSQPPPNPPPPPYLSTTRGTLNKRPHRDSKNNKLRSTTPMQLTESGEDIDKYAIFMHQDISRNPSGNGGSVYSDVMASCLKTRDSPPKRDLEKLDGRWWPECAEPLKNTIEIGRSGHNFCHGQDQSNCETKTYSIDRGLMQPEGMYPKGRDWDRDVSKQQGSKRESFTTRRPGRASKTKNMEFSVDRREEKEEHQNYDGLFPNNKRLEDHVDFNFINPDDKNANPRLSLSSRPKPTFEYEISVECYDSQQVNRLHAAILNSSRVLNETIIQPPKKLSKMQENHVKRHSSYPKKSPSRPILLYKLVLKCSDPTQIKTIYGALLESSIVLNSCVYSSKGNKCVPLSRMKNTVDPAERMITPNHRGSSPPPNHARCGPPSLTPVEDQRDQLQTHLNWPCKEIASKGTGPHWWNEMGKSSCAVGRRENNDPATLSLEKIDDRFKIISANCLNRGGIGEDAISSWRGHLDESMNTLASCGEKGQLSRQLFDDLSLLESLFSQCEAQCKERRIRFPECLQVPAKVRDNLEGPQPRDDQLHNEDKNHHQSTAPKIMLPYIQRPSCNLEYCVALEDPFRSLPTLNVPQVRLSQRSSTITEESLGVQVESATVATTTIEDVESPQIPDVTTTATDVPCIADGETQSEDVILISNAVAMEEMVILTNASKPDINNQIADIFSCDDDTHRDLPPTSPSRDTHHEDLPTFASSVDIGQQIADIIVNTPANIDAKSDTHDLSDPSVCLLPSAMGVDFVDEKSGQSNNVDKQKSSTQDDSEMLKESSTAQHPPEIGVQTSSVVDDETFLGWLARTTGINVTSNASQTSPREPGEYSWWLRVGASVQTEMDESGSKNPGDVEQQELVDKLQNAAQRAWWINPCTSLQTTIIDQPKFKHAETVSSIEHQKSILNSFYEEILTQPQGNPLQTESRKSFTTKTLLESGGLHLERTPSFTTETQHESDPHTEGTVSVTTQELLEKNPQIERKYSRTDEPSEIVPGIEKKKSLTIKNQLESNLQSAQRASLKIDQNKSSTIIDQLESNPQTVRRIIALPSEENPQTARWVPLITEKTPQAERRMSQPTNGPQVERRESEKSTIENTQSNRWSTQSIRIVSGTTTQDQKPGNNNSSTTSKISSAVKPETSDKALETDLVWIPTSPPQLKRELGSHKIKMEALGEMKRESVTKDVQTIGQMGSNIQTRNQCAQCEEPTKNARLPSDDKNATSSSTNYDIERSNRKPSYLDNQDVKNLQPNCSKRCTTFDSHQPSQAPPTIQGKQVSENSQVSNIEDLALLKRLAMASSCTSCNMGTLKMEGGRENIFGVVSWIDGVNYKLSYVSPELLQTVLQNAHVGDKSELMQKRPNNASLEPPFSLSIMRESQEDIDSKQSTSTKKRKLSTSSQTKLTSQPIINDKPSEMMASNNHENEVDSHVIDSFNNEIPRDSTLDDAPPRQIDGHLYNNPSSRLERKSMSNGEDSAVDKPMTNAGQIVCADSVNHDNIDHACLQLSHIDDSELESGQLQLSIADPPNNQQIEMNLRNEGPPLPTLHSNKPPRRIVTRTSFMTSLASNVRALVNVKQTSKTSSSV